MLKIKDNVDLKELEKYGFEEDKELTNKFQTIYSIQESYQKLCVSWEGKELFLYEMFNSNAFIFKNNIIYGLIKADLVEKVEE